MHALCSGAVALACHLVLAQVACQGGDREHLSHVKRRTQGLRVAGKLHGFFKVRTRGREIKVVQGGKACAKKRKSNAADQSSKPPPLLALACTPWPPCRRPSVAECSRV